MTKLVCESLEELNEIYGEGYTSTSTSSNYPEEAPEEKTVEAPAEEETEEQISPEELNNFIEEAFNNNTPDEAIYQVVAFMNANPYIHHQLGEIKGKDKYAEAADLLRSLYTNVVRAKKSGKKVSVSQFKKYIDEAKKLPDRRAAFSKVQAYFEMNPELFDLQETKGYKEIVEDFENR
jgi:hypothetical protein